MTEKPATRNAWKTSDFFPELRYRQLENRKYLEVAVTEPGLGAVHEHFPVFGKTFKEKVYLPEDSIFLYKMNGRIGYVIGPGPVEIGEGIPHAVYNGKENIYWVEFSGNNFVHKRDNLRDEFGDFLRNII